MVIQPITGSTQKTTPKASGGGGIAPIMNTSAPVLQTKPKEETTSAQTKKEGVIKTAVKAALPAIKGFIQQVPTYAKATIKKPVATVGGVSASVLEFGGSIVGAIQRGITSVTKVNFPERWDMTKQLPAFKEVQQMRFPDADEKKALEIGKFIGQIVPYALTTELASLSIGSKVLIPAATKLAPKLVKVVPLINNAIGFSGVGQLTYDPSEGTRVERLKSDLITLAVFETGGFLAKGITKQTSKLISKTIKDIKLKLGKGKPVAIDEAERVMQTAKEAIVKDTGKQPQSLFISNLDKASEKELKLLEAPKPKSAQAGLYDQPLYRGGGQGETIKGMTAKDVVNYETKELGNKINVEKGVDLSKIPSEKVKWLTLKPEDAKQYGKVTTEQGTFKILAKDNYGGVLVAQQPLGDVKPQISAKPNRVGETPKVVPQAQRIETPQVGEGTKLSKVGISIEAKAIEKRLTKTFGGTAEYSPTTIKEQSKILATLTKDIDRVKRIISGKEPLPRDVKIGTLFQEMENYAMKNKDVELLRQMANSPLASETSFYAQELRFLAERSKNSPVKLMKEIVKVREEAFKQKYKGRTQKELTDSVVKDIKSKIKPPDKYDWNTFLDTIVCK